MKLFAPAAARAMPIARRMLGAFNERTGRTGCRSFMFSPISPTATAKMAAAFLWRNPASIRCVAHLPPSWLTEEAHHMFRRRGPAIQPRRAADLRKPMESMPAIKRSLRYRQGFRAALGVIDLPTIQKEAETCITRSSLDLFGFRRSPPMRRTPSMPAVKGRYPARPRSRTITRCKNSTYPVLEAGGPGRSSGSTSRRLTRAQHAGSANDYTQDCAQRACCAGNKIISTAGYDFRLTAAECRVSIAQIGEGSRMSTPTGRMAY